ncbi:MAG: alkaline phosphatase, partial [Bacteroidetes bacterium]|nr:alkaline phosphatase [Bacteroidota bacterium]
MKKIVLFFLLCTFCVLQSKSQVTKIKHVVLIGFDGFGAYAVPDADMPV